MALSEKDIFRLFNLENISDIQKEMIRQDANATGKTAASLRSEETDQSGKMFGSRAFNLPRIKSPSASGRPSIEIGSPPGTDVPLPDLYEWAKARGYKGDVPGLKDRIFAVGTVTVNESIPRDIVVDVITPNRLQELYKRLKEPLLRRASSEIVNAFKNNK